MRLPIVLILSLVSLCLVSSSTNISIFRSIDALKADYQFELLEMRQFLTLVGITFKDFDFADSGKISTANYKFSNIRVTNALLNPLQVSKVDIDDDSPESVVVFEGKQVLEIDVSFDYSYNYIALYNDNGKGTIKVYTNDFLIRKTFKNEGFPVIDFGATYFTGKPVLVEGKYKNDSTIINSILTAFIGSLANTAQGIITQKLRDTVNTFYSGFDNNMQISANTFVPSEKLLISKEISRIPLNTQKGVTYYWKGSVIGGIKGRDVKQEMNRLRNLDDSFYNFNPAEGSAQFLISMELFNDVYSYLNSDKALEYTYTTSDFRDATGINLNVDYISKFYPNILAEYPPDSSASWNVNFTNFKFSLADYTTYSKLSTNISTNIKYFIGKEVVFSFSTVLKVEVIEDLKDLQLNFKFDKSTLSILNTIIDSEFSSGTNMNQLINATLSQFNLLLEAGNYKTLLAKPLDLSYFASKVNQIKLINPYGFLILAEHAKYPYDK